MPIDISKLDLKVEKDVELLRHAAKYWKSQYEHQLRVVQGVKRKHNQQAAELDRFYKLVFEVRDKQKNYHLAKKKAGKPSSTKDFDQLFKS